ncbi:hypothetical protein BDFB_002363 [Asbolus verrucosus]|nr:hypothetical protein BDFB_002363 [Asbolus verrucosus]
MQKCRKL